MTNFILYFKKGERYKTKAETIEKWANDDRKLDEKLTNPIFPSYVDCSHCHGVLREESRHIDSILDVHPRVKFIAFCESCGKGEIVWDNGERSVPKTAICPKCHSELKVSRKSSKNKSVYSEECPNCDYRSESIYDFKKSQEERLIEEKTDQELLSKFRSQYCLSHKEGYEYIQQMENISRLTEMMKESEEKSKDPDYQKAESVEKVTLTELHKILSKKFKSEDFVNLNFANPEIVRYVIVPFTVQDIKKISK